MYNCQINQIYSNVEYSTHSELVLQVQSLILPLQQQQLRSFHTIPIGNLRGALVPQAIVHRIRISQIGQAARTLQRALIIREEAALIERQVHSTAAASQAKSVASATAHVERASSRIVCLLIQAQVTTRSRKIAGFSEAIPSEAAANIAHTCVALPGLLLLLLQDGTDITLDSCTSSSKSITASHSTAIALHAAGLSVDRCVLFLFLHLYDLILKGRKGASFNERYDKAYTMVRFNLCENF